MTELIIGGVARYSACDWPGELVATVFCQGCPWLCRYCHNVSLRSDRGDGSPIGWAQVAAFLKTRRGLLDGVVFSGGEPLHQAALGQAIAEVKALGFRVGLHTGGGDPERFAAVLPTVDWVGFDVKAPFDLYERVTRVAHSGDKARESLVRLLESGVDYEVRTTVHTAVIDEVAMRRLATALRTMGVKRYALQPFRAIGCADAALCQSPSALSPDAIRDIGAGFADFIVRAN